jgi:rhodanese-related sulfurtransferase
VRAVPPWNAHAMNAADYFAAKLAFETDATDVAEALATGEPGFTLIDARSEEAYAAGHIPGATRFDPAAPPVDPVVVYCWGPGCNGATKLAHRLAQQGHEVREMIGGFEYWAREGHPVEGHDADAIMAGADPHGLVKVRGAISCLC